MNEELKIIIKAITTDAKKNLDGVKKKLGEIDKSGEEAGKSISAAMAKVAKGAAVAVGAVAALTTAMVALGKSSLEFQKEQAKLNTAFQAMGSTAKQATTTYKELFRFLGDTGKATEAAQSLSKITTSQKELAEWTKILQGAYASFGTSLPTESLAEAINETIKVGKITGTAADAFNWLGVSEDAVNEKLATLTSTQEREAYLRGLLNSLYSDAANIYERNNSHLLAYNESQANLNIALANATRYVIPLMTTLNDLATTILEVLKPAFETICAVIIVFVEWLIAGIQYIGTFFSLFGNEGVAATKAVSESINDIKNNTTGLSEGIEELNSSLNEGAEAAKELKKQTMGFDELNVVNSPTTTSASGGDGGGSNSGVDIPKIKIEEFETPYLEDFQKNVDAIKEKLKPILALVGLVGAGLLLWKISDFTNTLMNAPKLIQQVKDLVKKYGEEEFEKVFGKSGQEIIDSAKNKYSGVVATLKAFAGWALIIAGAVLLIQGYSDAWVNGIDWANFAAMVGGIAAVVGGIALVFGTKPAGITAIIGGISLIVVGIKDFIENGYSLETVLTILAGVIAVVVGVCLAFNTALLANPITWIIIGIAALVAIFVILWNECEGFRNFWINLWEKVKEGFANVVETLKPLIEAIKGAFKEAWEVIKVLWATKLVPMFKEAWEKIKAIWDFVKPYFKMVWENIKVIFSVVKEVLGEYFKAAWEGIKIVWNQVVGYFTAIWETIRGIFSVVKSVLTGNWSEATEGIKGIVNTWKDYFSNTWENIKKIFSVVGTFFKNSFKAAWDGIKSIFGNVVGYFSDVWDKIKNIFSKIGSTVGEMISNTVKSAIIKMLSRAIGIINGFITAINAAISVINAIPGVNIKTLESLEVPKLAKGGIVNSATAAIIGERGKEAVLPLENNTEWMDKLADRIAARNSSPSKIILKVGEKELGYATINSINGITKQTGTLPLVLV